MKTILGLALGFGLALQAAAPIPRPAGELKLVEPSGKEITLASLKGKVVVVQFLFTTCPHCQNAAVWLSKMNTELGPKGVQVYGVAVNEEVNTPDPAKNKASLASFSQFAKFPVGISTTATLMKFMGFSVLDRWGVPQFAVIDKKGVIRAQTTPSPMKGQVVEEPVMRDLVNKLLLEK
jgi:cytochrome oxidase Cu insertion factor (SCO1/SenC/PrrC family)